MLTLPMYREINLQVCSVLNLWNASFQVGKGHKDRKVVYGDIGVEFAVQSEFRKSTQSYTINTI